MHQIDDWRSGVVVLGILVGLTIVLQVSPAARADFDESLYIGPDELRPGMKGFGRTVMSGTQIETFDIEVISVMHNAFYAKQDVILVRCAGLGLEHSGVIGGMSGSPCYIEDDQGRQRLMGAVAYAWSFSKDPICGVQPITQMLDIPEVRKPGANKEGPSGSIVGARAPRAPGVPAGGLLFGALTEPLDKATRFSVLNEELDKRPARPADAPARTGPLEPLHMPVMVSGASSQPMTLLTDWLRRYNMTPVAAGGPSTTAKDNADNVTLEPGSVLCVPLMTGDMTIDVLGTCTAVTGDRVLGFGHSISGEGSIEMPLATGFVHMVLPSIAQSNKIGASLKTVGTLWGDEATGIFGTVGDAPRMVPLDVVVHDVRGETTYHYQVVQEEYMTGVLLATGVLESIYAHTSPPREHTIRYEMEVEFENLGTYRTSNFNSQRGPLGIMLDLLFPTETLMTAPVVDKAKALGAKVEITIEQGARAAMIHQVTMPRTMFKPGETVEVNVRWIHYRQEPRYTFGTYQFPLPKDLPDGGYSLVLASGRTHLGMLKAEKPHLFRAETMPEALDSLNLTASFPDNRLYLRLALPTGGIAYKKIEMPELPSFRRKILADSKRTTDLSAFTDAKVVEYEMGFDAMGKEVMPITVSRQADQ